MLRQKEQDAQDDAAKKIQTLYRQRNQQQPMAEPAILETKAKVAASAKEQDAQDDAAKKIQTLYRQRNQQQPMAEPATLATKNATDDDVDANDENKQSPRQAAAEAAAAAIINIINSCFNVNGENDSILIPLEIYLMN